MVPLGSDYAGTPTFRPNKVDASGLQHMALDQDNTTGTAASGVVMQSGGSGKFGWLSSIYSSLVSLGTTMSNVYSALTNGTQKTQITSTPSPQVMTATPSTKQIGIVASAAAVALRVGASDLANRKTIMIRNVSPLGGAVLYVGGSGVLDTTGWPIYPGELFTLDQNPANTATIYGYSTGVCTVAVMEVA
ncbi:hypothetical protein JJB07_14930 [Tumebacillus sp. ITR2]|uniref:Uncharacterized protein n=1 Tax=Tumebacillus amylolyticus TaxID=2801339 RepID=A0ABS1JCE5_9BACL|nr:hypothetical protein [Tumebacillus amylolyticus]MBL0387933.1 hypothetical protein [Tumebacillus amylolyticus]